MALLPLSFILLLFVSTADAYVHCRASDIAYTESDSSSSSSSSSSSNSNSNSNSNSKSQSSKSSGSSSTSGSSSVDYSKILCDNTCEDIETKLNTIQTTCDYQCVVKETPGMQVAFALCQDHIDKWTTSMNSATQSYLECAATYGLFACQSEDTTSSTSRRRRKRQPRPPQDGGGGGPPPTQQQPNGPRRGPDCPEPPAGQRPNHPENYGRAPGSVRNCGGSSMWYYDWTNKTREQMCWDLDRMGYRSGQGLSQADCWTTCFKNHEQERRSAFSGCPVIAASAVKVNISAQCEAATFQRVDCLFEKCIRDARALCKMPPPPGSGPVGPSDQTTYGQFAPPPMPGQDGQSGFPPPQGCDPEQEFCQPPDSGMPPPQSMDDSSCPAASAESAAKTSTPSPNK